MACSDCKNFMSKKAGYADAANCRHFKAKLHPLDGMIEGFIAAGHLSLPTASEARSFAKKLRYDSIKWVNKQLREGKVGGYLTDEDMLHRLGHEDWIV